jgi:hypothetical protein
MKQQDGPAGVDLRGRIRRLPTEVAICSENLVDTKVARQCARHSRVGRANDGGRCGARRPRDSYGLKEPAGVAFPPPVDLRPCEGACFRPRAVLGRASADTAAARPERKRGRGSRRVSLSREAGVKRGPVSASEPPPERCGALSVSVQSLRVGQASSGGVSARAGATACAHGEAEQPIRGRRSAAQSCGPASDRATSKRIATLRAVARQWRPERIARRG